MRTSWYPFIDLPSIPDSGADVIVIGAGPGGASFSYALAAGGRRVLLVEKGRDLSSPDALRGQPPETTRQYQSGSLNEQLVALRNGGRNAEPYEDVHSGKMFIPFVGSGTGGSSSLYGMALERRYPHDFENWPIDYAALAPWYREAERLYGVQGSPDPLRKGEPQCQEPVEPLSAANESIFGHLRRAGVHPYRQHLACRRLPSCRLCQSYLCLEAECKLDARVQCIEPARRTGHLRLLAEARVVRLEAAGRKVIAAVAEHQGTRVRLTARLFVLAAGALATPRLLLQSGLANGSGLVGRRLMRHAIDLFVLTLAPRFNRSIESKELAYNDYYAQPRNRLGTVQSFGMAPSLDYLRNRPGRNLWKVLGPAAVPVARLFERAPVVAGILDDEPLTENRVEPGERARIWYRLSARDRARRSRFRRTMMRAFARFGPVRVFGTPELPALGHVCGTAMFGERAECSVLDANNRAHELDNLFVIDGSFFPTSGGVNPALTIIANALRVARHVHEQVL